MTATGLRFCSGWEFINATATPLSAADRPFRQLLCRRIYNRAKEDETKKDEAKEGEETGEWLQNLIQVMTYQELCQRRRENRSMRRKYY